jgi:hypothetical protein
MVDQRRKSAITGTEKSNLQNLTGSLGYFSLDFCQLGQYQPVKHRSVSIFVTNNCKNGTYKQNKTGPGKYAEIIGDLFATRSMWQ